MTNNGIDRINEIARKNLERQPREREIREIKVIELLTDMIKGDLKVGPWHRRQHINEEFDTQYMLSFFEGSLMDKSIIYTYTDGNRWIVADGNIRLGAIFRFFYKTKAVQSIIKNSGATRIMNADISDMKQLVLNCENALPTTKVSKDFIDALHGKSISDFNDESIDLLLNERMLVSVVKVDEDELYELSNFAYMNINQYE